MLRRIFVSVLIAVLVIGLTPLDSKQMAYADVHAIHENFQGHNLSSATPIRVVIELREEPSAFMAERDRRAGRRPDAAAMRRYEEALRRRHRDVVRGAGMRGVALRPLRDYTLVLNGFVADVPGNQIGRLALVPGVLAVWPDVQVEAHDLTRSTRNIRTPLALGLPGNLDGSGVVVSVLDTGVDYMHPDLGGGFGPNFRVFGGWDFVDDDSHPMETKNMPGTDAGGRAFNTSHGTHVAATVAAVAPGARILAVRVLGPTGRGSSADVMAGIEWSVRAGAHIVNMSLGMPWGHENSPWARAVDNAVRAGAVFAVAAGNSGPNDGTMSAFAASSLAIAVGMTDTTPKVIATAGHVRAVGSVMALSPAFDPLFGRSREYVWAGLGRAGDFTGLDVNGRVVLMTRGVISFAAKSRNARDRGAAAAIIYNNVPGPFSGTLGTRQYGDIPTMSISQEDGTALKALPVAERSLMLNLGEHDIINAASSRGPTPMLEIKPDVVAPGTDITAAFPFPGADGSHVPGAFQREPSGPWYGTATGTSMAAPHVAGAAAILLQVNPTWTPEQVRLALMNTAGDVVWPHGPSFRPVDQGAGNINVARAIAPNLMINPGALNFRTVGVGSHARTVNLRSLSTSPVTYNVVVRKFNPAHAYTITSPTAVTLLAGGAVDFPLTLNVSPELPPSVLNLNNYVGFVYFVNMQDPTDTYRIPFHFVNQLPVSQVTTTPNFFSPNGDGVQDTTTVSFTVDAPVAAVRVMAGAAGFWRPIHILAPTAPTTVVAPGVYSFVWNGVTLDGHHVLDGSHLLYAQWLPVGGTVWQSGFGGGVPPVAGTYGRVIVDRHAPELHNVAILFDPARPGHYFVRGFTDDFSITVFQSVGGSIRVNGLPATLTSRNDPRHPGADWTEFESTRFPTNLESPFTVTIEARDSAGNVTLWQHTYSPFVLRADDAVVTPPATPGRGGRANIPGRLRTTNAAMVLSGSVLPGMEVRLDGQLLPLTANHTFQVAVQLSLGTNTLRFEVSVPAWGDTTPMRYPLRIRRRSA
ncbi:MAG: Minor extracellular protease vpr [Firmicutes bacterium]|nr:Minor extracellular protease vpr [Bacillota bacterium]